LWSLAVEEQFYLIWPITLYLLWRRNLISMTIFATIAGCSFGLNLATVHGSPAFAFYSPFTRLWELVLGAMLTRLRLDYVRATANASSVAGLILVLLSCIGLSGENHYPGWRALAPTFGAVLIIAAGPRTWFNQRILSSPPLTAVGLVSYPFYLWHWPLLSLARINSSEAPTPAARATIVLSALALAALTYYFIERPIRFGGHWRPPSLRLAPVALLALLCSIGALGVVTDRATGFSARFPDPIRYLADYAFDQKEAYRAGKCLLYPDQDEHNYGSNCIDADAASDRKPLVVLWGDSHAAHLYPGLRQLQRSGHFSLAQLTKSACPPILGLDADGGARCEKNNEFVIRTIKKLRPKVLILAAQWWAIPKNRMTALGPMVVDLKNAGIDEIILVGPVPVWDPSLPKLLLAHYTENLPKHVPDRMAGASLHADLESTLREIARRYDLHFVSAIDAFCISDICLTKVGDRPSDLVAWDSAHLTTAGSVVLAERVFSEMKTDLVLGYGASARP
jgi:hypothetical protein